MNVNYTTLVYLGLCIFCNFQAYTAFDEQQAKQEIGAITNLLTHAETEEQLLAQWFSAAKSGDLEILKTLIHKVDINAQNKSGHTALILAAHENHKNIAKLLLTIPGINVNIQNNYGNTALMWAAAGRRKKIIRLLLRSPEINLNAQNKTGNTALMYAACRRDCDVTKILLGIDQKIKDQVISRESDPKTTIKFNLQNKDGKTALMRAIERNTPNALLISQKINELTKLAFQAINQTNLEKLKWVTNQIGIDNITDENGNTLLDKAFSENCYEIIFFLLQNAQDPQELLSRFPFESMSIKQNPDLFAYFVNLAYGQESTQINSVGKDSDQYKFCHVCENKTITVCSKCKKIYYCSVKCQKDDWVNHKHNCKRSN